MLTYLLYSIREEFIKFSFNFSLISENGELYKRINKGESVKISRTEMRSYINSFRSILKKTLQKFSQHIMKLILTNSKILKYDLKKMKYIIFFL